MSWAVNLAIVAKFYIYMYFYQIYFCPEKYVSRVLKIVLLKLDRTKVFYHWYKNILQKRPEKSHTGVITILETSEKKEAISAFGTDGESV